MMNFTLTTLMASFDGAAAVFWSWLGLSLFYGTLLAFVTWLLLRTAFRRAGLLVAGAVWTMVLLKFIVPAGPGVPISLATLLDAAGARIHESQPITDADAVSAGSENVRFLTIFEHTSTPAVATPHRSAEPLSSWSWPSLFALAYFALVAGLMMLRIRGYRAFLAQCRTLPPVDPISRSLVIEACKRRGLRRIPDVRLSDASPAPFVVGFLRPTLVLSSRNLHNPDEAEAVVLHEIAHLRPLDLLIRSLQCLVGTLLFFWPVVAWVNRRIDLVREHACDDWALSHGRLSAAEYARCLLRAIQPVRSNWRFYHPAAMAANRNHVERRIEMILKHSNRTYHARNLGVGALVMVAAWGVFALSGSTTAKAAIAPGDANTPKKDGETKVVVTRVRDDGGGDVKVNVVRLNDKDVTVTVNGEPLSDAAAPGDVTITKSFAWVTHGESTPALAEGLSSVMFCRMDDQLLAHFAAEHPAADVDADGAVTLMERDAYLAALATLAPMDVLAKFPTADLNGDATLDTAEAVQLVNQGMFNLRVEPGDPKIMAFAAAGNDPHHPTAFAVGAAPMIVARTDVEDATPPASAADNVIWVAKDADGKKLDIKCDVDIKTEETAEGTKTLVVCAEASGNKGKDTEVHGLSLKIESQKPHGIWALAQPDPCDDVGEWLLSNILLTPTPPQIQSALKEVQDAPLREFMNWHPDADTDASGSVSPAERDAFMANEMKTVRNRLLVHFPAADADRNGELTEEEMHEFFKNGAKAGSGATAQDTMIFVGGPEAAAGSDAPVQVKTRVIVKTVDEDTPDSDAGTNAK